ncbi:myosin light chain kinase 3-like [Oncorhynchus masou masou]|uniref:myosin light chain kinase 3-like n=1 Tax=Oncorhynchus masou masou TaxID=90313 RepID=UPI003183BBEB
MRDMGGKEKKIVGITNVPKYQGSDKKPSPCCEGRSSESAPGSRKQNGKVHQTRLPFFRHLEKVETMRSFWELKHVEQEGERQQGSPCPQLLPLILKQVEKKGDHQQLKDNGMRDGKDKVKLSLKGQKAQKKKKPPHALETLLLDQVEKLNRQNAELSHGNGVVLDMLRAPVVQPEDLEDLEGEEEKRRTPEREEEKRAREEEEGDIFGESEEEEGREEQVGEEEVEKRREGGEEESSLSPEPLESSEELGEVAASSKNCVTEEDLLKDDLKKSRVEERKEEDEEGGVPEGVESQAAQSKAEKMKEEEEVDDGQPEEYIIDFTPPPAAPFDHRIVTPKPHQIATFYAINRDEVLGGGRFGQVHKCVENSSGLTLAAKMIKARSQKEKDVVKNEIQVMNQLNHANLIQLYAAFESRHDIILVMEYVDGGELFDRIIDENSNLTELDTVLFIRQICEGLQYMHRMYILHLDLKPENILCVSRATNKIKIIDFGLARRLTGLSPFLGDDDNETLNNILACQWNFEEEAFTDISEEAKDFITRLLVKSKSWRMSASQSLKHSWLSDHNLHYRLHQKLFQPASLPQTMCNHASTGPSHPASSTAGLPGSCSPSPIQNECPLQNDSQDPVGTL